MSCSPEKNEKMFKEDQPWQSCKSCPLQQCDWVPVNEST